MVVEMHNLVPEVSKELKEPPPSELGEEEHENLKQQLQCLHLNRVKRLSANLKNELLDAWNDGDGTVQFVIVARFDGRAVPSLTTCFN